MTYVASGFLTNCIHTSIFSSLAKIDSGCAALKTDPQNFYVCFLGPPKIDFATPNVSSAFSGLQKAKHEWKCLVCVLDRLYIYHNILPFRQNQLYIFPCCQNDQFDNSCSYLWFPKLDFGPSDIGSAFLNCIPRNLCLFDKSFDEDDYVWFLWRPKSTRSHRDVWSAFLIDCIYELVTFLSPKPPHPSSTFLSKSWIEKNMLALSGLQDRHRKPYVGSAFSTNWIFQNLYPLVKSSMT